MVTVHPSEEARITALGGVVKGGLLQPREGEKGCPFKKDGLCELHLTNEKPFGCIASPFTLNRNGTLIVRNRYKMLPCYKGDGEKVPAYKAFRSSLDLIFGEAMAESLDLHLDMGGGDIIVPIEDRIFAILTENDLIKQEHKMPKGYGRTFGQDIMRGEHTVERKGDFAGLKAPGTAPGAKKGASGAYAVGGAKVATAAGGVDIFGEPIKAVHASGLAKSWDYPPFTVLNARDGWWQERKREWLALGIKSELGRVSVVKETGGGNTMPATDYNKSGERGWPKGSNSIPKPGSMEAQYSGEGGDLPEHTGTSIFDPVVCELAYKWFCPPGGHIFDPFAGGSVRGIVASAMGRRYTGIELRGEQVLANQDQLSIASGPAPEWIQGDSREAVRIWSTVHPSESADFLFTCPPYADLEVYSDDPRDISTLSYDGFLDAYASIIEAAARILKEDRFACIVIGDARGKDGLYYGLPADTIKICQHLGLALYNEAVLITAVGSLPVRVGKQFTVSRKMGKTHQNVLVFVKGDPRRAAAAVNGDTNG